MCGVLPLPGFTYTLNDRWQNRSMTRGGTPFQEANKDVPLDGVAFTIDLIEWGRKFSDFWGKWGFKMGRFSVTKAGSCCLLNLTISSH